MSPGQISQATGRQELSNQEPKNELPVFQIHPINSTRNLPTHEYFNNSALDIYPQESPSSDQIPGQDQSHQRRYAENGEETLAQKGRWGIQPARPEVTHAKEIRQQQIHQDRIRQEQIRERRVRQEQVLQEKALQEQARQERILQEQVRQEQLRQKQVRQAPSQNQRIRQRESRILQQEIQWEQLRREQVRQEELHQEMIQRKLIRQEETRQEKVLLEQARHEKAQQEQERSRLERESLKRARHIREREKAQREQERIEREQRRVEREREQVEREREQVEREYEQVEREYEQVEREKAEREALERQRDLRKVMERARRQILNDLPLMRYIPASSPEDAEDAEAGGRGDSEHKWVKSNLPFLPLKENRAGCYICMMDFEQPGRREEQWSNEDDPEPIRLLPCGHAYHKSCIDPWILHESNNCPYCRHPITRNSTPIFARHSED